MSRRLDRRALLSIGLASLLAACSSKAGGQRSESAPAPLTSQPLEPTSVPPTVAAATAEPSTTTAAPATTSNAPTTVVAAGSPARYVNEGPTDSARVALTFHLGGSPSLVAKLLDVLHQRSVRVTAFGIGEWLDQNPKLAHRVVDEGHELGNHTYHHLPLLTLPEQQIRDEIAAGAAAVERVIGSIGRWFRPSGTDVPNQLILDAAGSVGYAVSVGYDIDSRDNTDPGSKAVVTNVDDALHGGAIVSLHFGHRGTITALPAILDAMQGRGLQPCTVSELLV